MTIRLPSGLRIVVSPTFPWEAGKGALEIRCSRAFHPHHVTTRLCLRLLDRYQQRLAQSRVLDVGCGTGILALAALRMGAYMAMGVDISRPAVELARRNAIGNGLEQVTQWIQGSADSVRGPFDWVVANLPFMVLMNLFDDMLRTLSATGALLLSGFHDIERHHVDERLELKGFSILDSLSGDLSFAAEPPGGSYTWVALIATRG